MQIIYSARKPGNVGMGVERERLQRGTRKREGEGHIHRELY